MYDDCSCMKSCVYFSCQTHIVDLVNELGLELCRQYTEGRKYMQLGGYRLRSYSSSLPSLSPLALVDLHRFITKVLKCTCISLSGYVEWNRRKSFKVAHSIIMSRSWQSLGKCTIISRFLPDLNTVGYKKTQPELCLNSKLV